MSTIKRQPVYTDNTVPYQHAPYVPPQRQRPAPTVARGVPPVRPSQGRPVPHPQQRQQRPAKKVLPKHKPRRAKRPMWLIVPLLVGIAAMLLACTLVTLGAGAVYAGGDVLPGVAMVGVDLGGMSTTEAANALQSGFTSVVLTTGDYRGSIDPARLGIDIDANASAQVALDYGRSTGGFGGTLQALVGNVDVPPVITVNWGTARDALYEIAPQFAVAPVNAGVQVVAGEVQPSPPRNGRALDVEATLTQLQNNPDTLADGVIELVMVNVPPDIVDAMPMVEQARGLLASPLRVRAFDPVSGDDVDVWEIAPESWSAWITTRSNPNSVTGLSITLDPQPVEAFLQSQQVVLGDGRYVDPSVGAENLRQAVERGRTDASLRVFYDDRQHTVQSGETIVSIAWDYGVPYPWILDANPNIGESLSVGQVITIPSPDAFLPFPVVFDKRIVVSISQQKMWAYEDDDLKWEWGVSTGISSSPTWPGIYQIQSHEENAYAGNWNLWMPYFMGVYQPIPGSEFTNGFHGFPSRGGSQLLWENSIGTKVTYGCILVSTDNVIQLYDWAEEGVVVEIQP